jgi:hypothetical protein
MTTDDVRRIVREELRRSGLTAEIVTDLAVNDDGGALGKGLGDRDLGGDFAGQYGIYSRPLDGADGIALNLDGAGNFSILIGYRNRQYEVQIEKGEVLLRDDQGQTFHLKRDGIYHLDAEEQDRDPGRHRRRDARGRSCERDGRLQDVARRPGGGDQWSRRRRRELWKRAHRRRRLRLAEREDRVRHAQPRPRD